MFFISRNKEYLCEIISSINPMNILFFNNAEVAPITNGIQRVTHLLSQAFINMHGFNCYSAYFNTNNVTPKTEFTGKIRISTERLYEQLSAFLIENKIEIIICQQLIGNEKTYQEIYRAVKYVGNCKSIYCLHASPDFPFTRPNNSAEMFRIIHKREAIRSIKKLAIGLLPLPIYNRVVTKRTRKEYTLYNDFFDKVVLLSDKFIDEYCRLSDISYNERSKVSAIANPLSSEPDTNHETEKQKHNEILIVSRLSDRQKRISESLKIWADIQKITDVDNWILRIVGTGEDELYYKHLVKKFSLNNVFFEGRQDPSAYYAKASIYMMTSAYEGFPMVLAEALQAGVVPVVYDSFSAVHDVIVNGYNGFIVRERDSDLYCRKLQSLMQNAVIRKKMALNGIKSINKFSIENVSSQWIDLFDDIKN